MRCRIAVFVAGLLVAAGGLAQARSPRPAPYDRYRAGDIVQCQAEAPDDDAPRARRSGPPVTKAQRDAMYAEPDRGGDGYCDGGCEVNCGRRGCTGAICGESCGSCGVGRYRDAWDCDDGYCDDCGDNPCSCGAGCFGWFRCGGCCFNPRGLWVRGEYLLWWVRGQDTPALVTTSPAGTAQAQAGVLPGATVLYGNQRIDDEARSGARITAGYWLDDCQMWGIEGSYFGLEDAGNTFSATGTSGVPILARPFFNTATNAQDADLVSFPNVVDGTITVRSTSQVQGAEANFRRAMCVSECRRIDIIGGYRFFKLDESLDVFEFTRSTNPTGQVPLGTTIDVADRFGTQNEFHGGQLGVIWHLERNCCWSIDVIGKIALGGVQEDVTIAGRTTTTVPNQAATTAAGGILALASNSGHFSRTRFAALPELTVNLNYRLNNCWQANVGYSIMVLSSAVRPGEEIDLNVDPGQFPPAQAGTQPRFAFLESEVWVQGLNFGLEYRF